MSRYHHRLWFFALLFFGLSCARSGRVGQTETAQVLEVIDGDTIHLTDGRKVRYSAINASEEGQPYYAEAKALNARFVEGKKIMLHYGKRRTDQYGRTLAVVTQDRIAVGDSLVAAGLAIVYGFSDNAELLPPLIQIQRTAMDRKVGLWSLPQTDDEDHYLASITSYRFHRPNCQWIAKVKPDRLREYRSKIEAYYDGLAPCHDCRPDTVRSAPLPIHST